MSNRTINLDGNLYDYMLNVSLRESELLRRLREETIKEPMARMQISPEQGQFMAMLVRMLDARQILEIGVFTGYSSICMGMAMSELGRIVACDVSEKWTSIARKYWREAGLEDRVDLKLAPALETLNALLKDGRAGSFDLAFIDADKENYMAYYEHALELLRPHGMILIDNVLWGGRVANPKNDDVDTVAIRKLNDILRSDNRIELSMVPIGDGLTMALKR